MRPDPLLVSRTLPADPDPTPTSGPRIAVGWGNPTLVRVAIVTVSLGRATMVALMAMTPVHLVPSGATPPVVGFTVGLHIAGMFALSPVFQVVADRLGRFPTIVIGPAMLLASAVITALGSRRTSVVMLGLILLGLGWSASTVAGSALLNDAAPAARRVQLQGRGGLAMNLAGALGGAVAGPLLAVLGSAGLAWTLLLPVAVVLATGSVGVRRSRPQLSGLAA